RDAPGLEPLELEGAASGQDREDDDEPRPAVRTPVEPGSVGRLHLRRVLDDGRPPGGGLGRAVRGPGMDDEEGAAALEVVEGRCEPVEVEQRGCPDARACEAL